MADMDLDELLDGPVRPPNRPSRFAPTGSKFKPKTNAKPSQSQPPLPPKEPNSIPPKKEELTTEPKLVNGNIEMDIDVIKIGVKNEEKVDLMESEEMEAEAVAEDEVVREIDVYFTPSINPNTRLYVLQYPLRPLWRPYEIEDRCQEVRVKPASAEMEIDLSVDVNSKNYDSDSDPRVHLKKQTLTSKWKPHHTRGHAIGVLSGNKLHVTPVHAVVQFRPSMQHLDAKESRRRTVKEEDPQEGTSSGAPKKMSKPSVQNKDNEEGWVPLKYHGEGSDLASSYVQKMVAGEGSPINFSTSTHDYLDSLCPGTFNDSSSSKGSLIRSLLSLPLNERFKSWFLQGPQLNRFDTLKHLAPEESIDEVLEVLLEHAHLVQGLWVPKSKLVYGTDTGIEVFARDLILLLFSKDMLIKNSEILSYGKSPNIVKAMNNVLNVLAVKRQTCNDWKLKELPDLNFIKLNPSLVKKQQKYWEALKKNIDDANKKKSDTKNKLNSNPINDPPIPNSAKKVGTGIPGGGTSGSAIPEEARSAIIKKALQKLFKDVKVCSYQQISQRLRHMAVEESARSTGFAREAVTAANSVDAYPRELQEILREVAVNIHGVCVPKSSPDNPQYDLFRKVVIDLFIAEPPNAKLKKAIIAQAAQIKLKRDMTTPEYEKVVKELCIYDSSAWVLKKGDGNPRG